MSETLTLHLTMIINVTKSDGPGRRYAIWLKEQAPSVLDSLCTDIIMPIHEITQALSRLSTEIEGVTILGDTTFKQADTLAELGREIKGLGLSLMVYSTETYQELRSAAVEHKGIRMLLMHTDILVAGQYLPQLPDHSRPWVGSTNQSIHFLSDRYHIKSANLLGTDSVEIRLSQTDESLTISMSGRPHHHSENYPTDIGHELSLELSHLLGKQWVDDLLHGAVPTISRQAVWLRDHRYWALVLDQCRARCIKWTLEQSNDVTLPRRLDEDIRDLHFLDLKLKSMPLGFGHTTEAIFSGPKYWGETIRVWSKNNSKPQSKSRLKKQRKEDELGDWLLIASLFYKLTRPKVLGWICTEVLQKRKSDRDLFISWLIDQSPFAALLRPRLGVKVLCDSDEELRIENFDALLELVTPNLDRHWTHPSLIERVPEGYLSGDSWAHLLAIVKLNNWAAHNRLYALGEACIKTVATLFQDVEPAVYFKGPAKSLKALDQLRQDRISIITLAQAWSTHIEEAQCFDYGEEGYLEAQRMLRYAERWRTLNDPLKPHIMYSETMLGMESN